MQIASSDNLVKLLATRSYQYHKYRSKSNLYMICEYCNGGSLKEYLKSRSSLTEQEALVFFTVIIFP